MGYLRDPLLTDHDNALLRRPYCGNPFIAPGTLGSKTSRKPIPRDNVSGGLIEDEEYYAYRFSENSQDFNEETVMPQLKVTPSIVQAVSPPKKEGTISERRE